MRGREGKGRRWRIRAGHRGDDQRDEGEDGIVYVRADGTPRGFSTTRRLETVSFPDRTIIRLTTSP